MSGFKKFIMQGNLVELAVAFVIGGAFATVVTSFTAVFMDVLGKLGGTPNFSSWVPGGVHVGAFLTAAIAFLVVAFIIYFFVVKPYEAAKERFAKAPEVVEEASAEAVLLTEIRDAIRGGRQF